jgi:hypothetical protein
MQGHPESPRLWEKHADSILREIGLTLTVHEPCLYSGTINGQHVLFMHQVDYFAIASPNAKTADIFLDMINNKLTIPVKRQGYLDMYNGIDVHQTRHYKKVLVRSFIDKVFEKHLATWMKSAYPSPARSTPLPSDSAFQKKFNSFTGDLDKKVQLKLAKDMQIGYPSGIRELIWAMTNCRPDLAYSSIKLSQSNSCPHKIHYHSLKHALKYLYHSKDDGLYFWRTQPRMELPEGPLPSLAIARTSFLTINHFSMPPRLMHMRIPTGLHASKPVGLLVVLVFNWQAVLSPTNVNFSRLLWAQQQKQNLWLHMTLEK